MSLQGTLRTLGIAEVLEFLAGRSATGRLEITADTGHATYWVSSGEIASVDYSFAREAGTDAAEATYYALAEVEGTFHFDEDQRPENVEDTEAISDVLARTADTADGWSYVEEVIATPQHWLSRSETLEDTVAVQPEWWVAIAAIADGISPQKLAHELDMRALAASTMASEMVRAGLLQVGEPRPEEMSTTVEESLPEEAAMTEEPPSDGHAHDVDAEAGAEPVAPHDGLNLFGGNAAPAPAAVDEADASVELDELVTELESHQPIEELHSYEPIESEHAPADDDLAPSPLSVVEPMNESMEESMDDSGDDAPAPVETYEADTAPASPALVWDAEATPEAPPAPPMEQEPAASAFDESPPVPEQSSDWDDDDGWATDHSQPATVAAAPAEEFQSAPAAADVFGTAPAVDTAAFPATGQHPGEGDSGETPDEYGTDDRSSVLKFLRRD